MAALTREELELHARALDLEERFVATKLADRDSDEHRQARAELNEFRTFWRQIREFFGEAVDVANGDAVAQLDAVSVGVKVEEG